MAAFRKTDEVGEKTMRILGENNKKFAASDTFELELLPKAYFHGNHYEIEFYEFFFQHVERYI